MSKRSNVDNSGEPPKKRPKTDLSRCWTHTNPKTGKEEGRLFHVDKDYRLQSNKRRQKAKAAKKKKSKSNSKSPSKSKDKSKEKEKEKSKDKSKDEEEVEDDDVKVNDEAKFHLLTKRFDGHVCVVTGAGRENLGRAVALRLAQEGAIVIIFDKMQYNPSIDAIKKKCREDGIMPSLEGKRVNITDEKAVKEAIKEVVDKYGFIDVLVNCATTHGEDRGKMTDQTSIKDTSEVMTVNLIGTLIMCKAVLPYMIEEDYGRIVNIASVWGKTGRPGHLAYSSAKAAVIAATKTMGKEYAETGVTINCVAPGFIDEAAEKKSYHLTVKEMEKETLVHRIGELEEVAGVIAFVASEENTYTTGFCYDISGGMV